MKNNRKKIFLILPTFILLAAVLSVGTTFGRYVLGTNIVFNDEDWNEENPIIISFNDLDPSVEEDPGIVEETPTTVYQVQPGDTFFSIAQKFRTTVEALAAYNNIEDPDSIQVGTILRIPPDDYVVPETETSSAQPTE